jgi:hypothetical protein
MTAVQKHLIIETLSSMNKTQMEKVLQFAKGIRMQSEPESAYDRFKKQAMKEIREALRESK